MKGISETLDLERLSKLRWHYLHRRFRTPFYTFLLYDGISKHLNPELLFPYEVKGVIYVDGEIAFSGRIWDETETEVLAEMDRNPGFMNEMFDISYALNRRIDEFLEDIRKDEPSGVSSGDMADRLKTFSDIMKQASAFMMFPLFVERYLETHIREAVEKVYPGTVDDIMRDLTTPVRWSSTEEAELDLLDIAVRAQDGKDVKSDIAGHVSRFGWLKNTSMDRQFYSEEDVRKKLDELSEGNPMERKWSLDMEKTNLCERIESYKNRFDDEHTAIWVDTLQEAIYYRSFRTERFYRNAFLLRDFFDEIATRIGVRELSDVFYLLPDEIGTLLQTGSSAEQEVIEKRKRGYVMYADGGETRIYSGEIVTTAKRKIRFYSEVDASDELRGQSAFSGIVSGLVRCILSRDDFEKLQKGDILVAHSTMPDYVPIMKKAGAIVTDEGGVLSHTSVISRELKKPCIIGTKIATRVLKDGDLVEVDADRGVVRVLKDE